MTHTEANQILDGKKWTFAKTMPKFPHWYIKREYFTDEQKFEDLVQFIRDNGTERRWFRAKYIYYTYNGYDYWTMGAPIHKTKIINKAKCKQPYKPSPRKKSVLSRMNANEQISRFLNEPTTSGSKKEES